MARPVPRFHDFIGQKQQISMLIQQLRGAKARGEPCPSTLLVGPSGAGKTLLAKALSDEFRSELITAQGYESVNELVEKLRAAKFGWFFHIDESHQLIPKAQEMLYGAIDHCRVPVEAPHQPGETTADTVEIEPCTILLSTDQPGKLLNALHKRIEIVVKLDFYNHRELRAIVDLLATDLGLLISPQAANHIARASGGVPRRAKHHLGNLRRHFHDAEQRQLEIADVRRFFKDFGIDANGLDDQSRKYLQFLHSENKASLDTLSLELGVDADYVRRQIEPQLQRLRLIRIGAGGRALTNAGVERVTAYLRSK